MPLLLQMKITQFVHFTILHKSKEKCYMKQIEDVAPEQATEKMNRNDGGRIDGVESSEK